MSRSPTNLRQSDLAKLIKVARTFGLDVQQMEMRDRAVFVHFGGREPAVAVNELDAWRAKRHARTA